MHPRILLTHLLLTAAALLAAPAIACAQQPLAGLTQYTFGSPSSDEVTLLELINRARANPNAEGQRLVATLQAEYPNGDSGVDYNQTLAMFAGFPIRPPLAFNVHLNAAAQAHLAENYRLGTDAHNSPDGTTPSIRAQQFGYTPLDAENCAGAAGDTAAVSPWQLHGTYELADPGHRTAILETGSVIGEVEVGLAYLPTGLWSVEDFGGNTTPPLLTGVVYNDNAKTGFYASGEGVSYVLVTSNLSSFYAVTVNGAYSLPLDLAPEYNASGPAPVATVTFTTFGGSTSTQTVTLGHTVSSAGMVYYDANEQVRYDNAKADWIVSTPPAFFAGEAALDDGVFYLSLPNGNAFGYYGFLSDPRYIYHFDLGYEYIVDAQDGQSGVYLYDFKSDDWFYTSPTFAFPYLWDFALNTVLYYYPDPNNPGRYNTDGVRYFYDFANGEIIVK